jgi:hypothetical protein
LDLPVRDPRPSLAAERADLLDLLAGLGEEEWSAPTESGHWRVKDVALHLLDDDLGWLSRGRDADDSGLLSTDGEYRDFVRALDEKNEQWVLGAAGLSQRVVVELLQWSGIQVAEYYDSIDLGAPSGVIWASGGAVPRWFDLCRDLTERWVHQQHIRDAVGEQGTHARFLPNVIGTFVWAFPYQYEATANEGTTVQLQFGASGSWHLERGNESWHLETGLATSPLASLTIEDSMAWRQLTGLPVPDGAIVLHGNQSLARALLDVRGIIV